jgi:hypothetical protein
MERSLMFEVFSCDRNDIASDIYDTTGNFHRLSQNQQLFCSAFVRERVVFFTTGFGPVTGSKFAGYAIFKINTPCRYFPQQSMLICLTAIIVGKITFKKTMVQKAPLHLQ